VLKVKVCGITNPEDALLSVKYGADALGFVFAESPRKVSPEVARNIILNLPPFIFKVGVFVNFPLDEVRKISSLCFLDLIQLHGDEKPDYCSSLAPKVIKAFQVKNESILSILPQYKVAAYLLDAYDESERGGTGKVFNWDIARRAKGRGWIILSGGLTPDNVSEAILKASPYAVDVSSGVESYPGKKDPLKLSLFLHRVKYEASR
jgi:phosphoribosylanthranilate isomerase